MLAKTLKALKGRMGRPGGAIGAITKAIETRSVPDGASPYLRRLQLLEPRTLQEKMLRSLIVAELSAQGRV